MEKELNIRIPKADCPCKRCEWALGLPNLINCVYYKVKPSEIFYESAPCPNFEEEEIDSNKENDNEYSTRNR